MLENLFEITNKLEYEEFGSLNLVYVEKQEYNLELTYSIYSGIEGESRQLWQVSCHEVQEHKIRLGEQWDYFDLHSDHVLLWSYQQPVSSLTFNRVNENFEAAYIIGKLYSKHRELVRSWIPFHSCFNKCVSLEDSLKFGYGKLAEGAEKLIVGYQEVLHNCGIKASYLSRPSKRWNDELGWLDKNKNLSVFITGKSYIIASKFIARRL